MRTLLELHYDSIHFERWKSNEGKAPMRRSEYYVFKSAVNSHRKKLCQRLVLPKTVKAILQLPRHEDELQKLENLRVAILREIQGEEHILIDAPEQLERIANAIESCPRDAFPDEVGPGCSLPEGSRVLLDVEYPSKRDVANAVRKTPQNDWLKVLMRPYGTP